MTGCEWVESMLARASRDKVGDDSGLCFSMLLAGVEAIGIVDWLLEVELDTRLLGTRSDAGVFVRLGSDDLLPKIEPKKELLAAGAELGKGLLRLAR